METLTVLFASAVPESVPVLMLVMPSVAELPVSGLMPVITGAAGARLSRLKPPVLLGVLAFPATSVTVVETLTAPWPRVVRLAAVRVTAWAAPLPVRVLVTLPAVPVNTTLMVELVSALTLRTPPTAVAAAAVLSATPWATMVGEGAF